MSTQSIHRATRTMPNPVRFAIFDYLQERISLVNRRAVVRETTLRTLPVASHSDRAPVAYKPLEFSSFYRAVKSQSGCVTQPDRRLGDERRSTFLMHFVRSLAVKIAPEIAEDGEGRS